MLLVDYETALDSVVTWAVLDSLHNNGISESYINIIRVRKDASNFMEEYNENITEKGS